ncbi:unnamed protein product [Cladocopium goreaui]|uniref:Uncharacterized protein n=1 Tax=Cladocopium goreaui TaxID=2562237 RepID=A0A9P1M437_9DINO|nr:unnamed protein product [Cladocopium goreaui]
MVRMIQLPCAPVRLLRRVMRQLAPLRWAAARLPPASADDGTALGLQCVGVARGAPGKVQAFGRLEALMDVRDHEGIRLLGAPLDTGDGRQPVELPECHPMLSSSLQRLGRHLHQLLLRHVARRGWSLDGEWSHELLLNLYSQSSHGAAPLAPKLYVHKDLSALTLLSLASLRRVFDNMFTLLK